MVDFVEFVAARRESLWRTAWALTGDAGRADDLVQTALVKVWPRWDSITAGGDCPSGLQPATPGASAGPCPTVYWFAVIDAMSGRSWFFGGGAFPN